MAISNKRRKEKMHERLTPEYIFNNTDLFRQNPKGWEQIDQTTLDEVKRRYKNWYASWVKQDSEEFLLDKK